MGILLNRRTNCQPIQTGSQSLGQTVSQAQTTTPTDIEVNAAADSCSNTYSSIVTFTVPENSNINISLTGRWSDGSYISRPWDLSIAPNIVSRGTAGRSNEVPFYLMRRGNQIIIGIKHGFTGTLNIGGREVSTTVQTSSDSFQQNPVPVQQPNPNLISMNGNNAYLGGQRLTSNVDEDGNAFYSNENHRFYRQSDGSWFRINSRTGLGENQIADGTWQTGNPLAARTWFSMMRVRASVNPEQYSISDGRDNDLGFFIYEGRGTSNVLYRYGGGGIVLRFPFPYSDTTSTTLYPRNNQNNSR